MQTPPKAWLSRAAFGGMFAFGIVMALLGAVLPILSERIRFDLSQAGGLFLWMNLAMLATSLVVGPVMDRFGHKPALVAGCLATAAALHGIAGATLYAGLLANVVLLGIGGGALNGATNTLIADLHADAREKSAALNLLGVFFGFGALFLPFIIGALIETLGLSLILYLAAALCLAPAALALALRFPPAKQARGSQAAETGRLLRDPLVLLLGCLLFCQSGNEFTMGGYISTFLTRELGLPVSRASFLLAAYWGSIMLARVALSRVLLAASGSRVVIVSALGAAAGIVLLLFVSGTVGAAGAVSLIGATFASIFPTTLGLAGSRFPQHSGTVFGILFAMALTGGMTLPWAVGHVAQAHGLRWGLSIAGGAALCILFLQLAISRRDRARAG